MSKKYGLNRGLNAFISDKSKIQDILEKNASSDENLDNEELVIKDVDIDEIYPNLDQPREHFDEDRLEELAQSIKEHGILQPIILIEQEDGYQIVAGERRYRASKLAGLKTVPAIIRELDNKNLEKLALIENIQREDLNPCEEAKAYRSMIDNYNMTQQELADSVGKSRPYIANILRLLNLDPRVLEMVRTGDISQSMGRELLSIEDGDEQYEKARQVVDEGLSVSKVSKTKTKRKPRRKVEKDIFIQQLEDDFEDRLGTKVNINESRRIISIDYYDDEDLQRLIDIIIGE